jgi:hypothetical protein
MHRKNTQIHVRTTNEEYEKICANSKAKGYPTLADYIRYQALEKDKGIEEKIVQVHRMLVKVLKVLKQE